MTQTKSSQAALFFAALALFILLPQFVFAPMSPGGHWHLGAPRAVVSGDEPHYLLQINSLLKDRDLDLRNNYNSVHQGSKQAGTVWAGRRLDHHTMWYQDDQRMDWMRLVDWDLWKNPKYALTVDASGRTVVPFHAGAAIDLNHAEYPVNAPGYPILLSFLLLPFQGTPWVEAMALMLSGLATLVAAILFRGFLAKYQGNGFYLNLAVLITFLATPIWHYSRTLYTEPFLMLFAVGAYASALKKDRALVAGLWIGLGVLVKPPFLLLAVPLLVNFLSEKKIKKSILLLLPVCIAWLGLKLYSVQLFGSPLHDSMIWRGRSFAAGLWSYLFSRERSLVLYSPAILIALFGWPALFRRYSRDALVLAAAFFIYLILMSLWFSDGGYCYGPRLMLPVLPFLFVGLATLPETKLFPSKIFRAACFVVLLMSVQINFMAVIQPWRFIGTHPWVGGEKI